MEHDASISVIDGQTLRLHKIRDFLDPIILTYRRAPGEKTQTFKSSIETLEDASISKQKSGHYSMTVNRTTAEMDPALAIREVHVTQGNHVARIDLIFFDEPVLQKAKQSCDIAIFMKCFEEKEDYQQILRGALV